MSKLKPYTKYQPVQYDYVDELPEGWQLLPNLAIFQERIERGHEDKELLSVTIRRGVIKQSELAKKDSSTLDKSKYLLVYPGDLVYSMRFRQGASGYSIHKGIVSPACTILRPKKNIDINQRYFYYMFRTGFYKNYVERFAYGIADGQIPLRYVDFKRMYSILPPLKIQNTIVEYLDRKTIKTQEFIQRKKHLIELLLEEKQSILRQATTKGIIGEVLVDSEVGWIGKIPLDWETKRIKYLGRFISGYSFSSGDFTEEGIKVIKISNIQPMKILWDDVSCLPDRFYNKHKNFRVFENDLVFALTRPIIKGGIKVAIIEGNEKLLINQRNAIFRPKKGLMKAWLYFVILNQDFINEFNLKIDHTGQQPNISTNDIGNIYIPFPSPEIQKEIVSHVQNKWSKLDKLISKANFEIEKAKEYQESLITQMVTGQLKVPALTQLKILN
jgi:type I restriction enzyme S subunit